jgi:hypothetical protein
MSTGKLNLKNTNQFNQSTDHFILTHIETYDSFNMLHIGDHVIN